MSPEPFVSRAKAPPAKRSEKGYGDENGVTGARGRVLGAGGSWLGCGFGQASRVLWRLGGVIAIAALGHLTSTWWFVPEQYHLSFSFNLQTCLCDSTSTPFSSDFFSGLGRLP